MTIQKKVYLTQEELNLLKLKAEALSISGRGWLSNYLRRLARTEVIYMDSNVQNLSKLLNITIKGK